MNSLTAPDSATEIDPFVITRWYPVLRRAAVRSLPRYLIDRIGPDDMVQETMLIGLAHWDQTKGRSDGEIFAWLSVILRNRIRMAIRHFRRPCSNSPSVLREQNVDDRTWSTFKKDDSYESDIAVDEELRQRLNHLIDTLPDRESRVLRWYFFDDRDLCWIGEQLNLSARQARRILKKGIDTILAGWNHTETFD